MNIVATGYTLQFFGEGYYCFSGTDLPSVCFKVNESCTGVDRIPNIPTERPLQLFIDQGIIHVKYLLELYAKAIRKIIDYWKLSASNSLEETPLELLERFTQLIVKMGYNKWTELSLSKLDLKHLPPQIALFRDLAKLDLSDNQLVILFPELAQLEKLEVLDVSGNKGVMLPDLSVLPNLKVLKANGCGLGVIPDWLDKCPNLERVELENNNIEDSWDRPNPHYDLRL